MDGLKIIMNSGAEYTVEMNEKEFLKKLDPHDIILDNRDFVEIEDMTNKEAKKVLIQIKHIESIEPINKKDNHK